jgi:UDP-3-O-[3-hydroxymyristoyl] glucosamine N-acyltransferase
MRLSDIAARLGCAVHGDGDTDIARLGDIERLTPEQELQDGVIYYVETPAILKKHPKAVEKGAVLTTKELAPKFRQALAVDGDARLTFVKLLKLFDKLPSFAPGIRPGAHVDPKAKVPASVAVLPGAVIMEDAVIGERCVIYPNAVIEPRAVIGEDSVIHSGVVVGYDCVVGKRNIIHGATVLGSDGFGFFDRPGGARHKVPQTGNVVLGDDVELGSGCTIDRGAIESTTIGLQTKLDNQVHIGHNCRIGRYCYIAGHSGFAGSVLTGDGVFISGNCAIKDHTVLAPGTIVMGMTGITGDTEPQVAYFGTPGRPAREMHKINAAAAELPALLKRVRELEARVGVAPKESKG